MSLLADSGNGDDAIYPAAGSKFSLHEFLSSSAAAELMDATADTGPVDNAAVDVDGAEFDEEEIERALDGFYGTSPLSTAPATPTPSRPSSPGLANSPQSNKRIRSPSPDLSNRNILPTPDVLNSASAQLDSKSKPRRNKKKSKAGIHPSSPSLSTQNQSSLPFLSNQNPLPTPEILNTAGTQVTSTSKSRRDKKKSKKSRKLKRPKDSDGHHPTPAQTLKKHIVPSQEHSTNYNVADIPSASTGFIAKPDEKGRGRVYALPELLAMGFKLIKWDGKSPKPILDSNGVVVAVLVGAPDDPSWGDACNSAYDLLCAKAPSFNFTKKAADHRRGKFPAVNVGISFGGGKMAPGNLCHTNTQTEALDDILASTPFIRLAGFASKAFAAWMPQVYDYYQRDFDKLLRRHSGLRRNFTNSVWASAALNFGPRTITARHRDFANLPFGICSITALGSYDPTKGGHAVLWELGLVIEFPPGSTILIPSAAISHSNTPISPSERRASFTQYSAGGLFRWVQHGFQTEDKFTKGMSDKRKAEVAAENLVRCKLGLALFPKLSDLRNPAKKKPAP